MAEAPHKKIIILAGPNGAGKTTFARAFLPQEAGVPRFINADLIAAGLAPFAPERAAIQAGRLMLDEIQRSTDRGESFAFETTLAGLNWLRRILPWRAQGYQVSIYFLRLPDAETAIARGRAGTTGRTPYPRRHHSSALRCGLVQLSRTLLPRGG